MPQAQLERVMQEGVATEKSSTGGIVDQDRTAVPSEASSEENSHPVDVEKAKADFQELSRQLSHASSKQRVKAGYKDIENPDDDDDFNLRDYLKSNNATQAEAGVLPKSVGVIWKDLNVIAGGGIQLKVRRFPDAIMEFCLSPLLIAMKFLPDSANPFMPKPKDILVDFTGIAKPGEMVLVLGRPGSGCSTFLKAISGSRSEYKEINGEMHYNGVEATKFLKHYSGETVYNPEADLHYATLTVGQTIKFALSTKTPGKRLPGMSKSQFIDQVCDLLLRMLNISHTKDTLVGDEFVRGVSGGERKRVSIAEMMATSACVVSYDNSTRGLDASTALDYAKSIRVQTDVLNMTTFVSIYQAGEGIYEQFDKVLVIDDGHCVFFGPRDEARQYFVDMGYEDAPRQTTADFLTGCTDPNERRYSEGKHEKNTPSTAEEMAKFYKESKYYKNTISEIDAYEREVKDTNAHSELEKAVHENKGSMVRKGSKYQASFMAQVMAIAHRATLLRLQDTFSLWTQYTTTIALALISGSLFLLIPATSSGAFTRGGALFISLLFNAFTAFAALPTQMMGRPILKKQVSYTLFRPAAYSLGTSIAELPFGAIQIFVFCLIMYFMCGFYLEAGHFFTFYVVILVTFWAMTSFFGLLGTITHDYNVAARLAAFLITTMVVYSGYLIPVNSMKRWLFWIYYINPVNYGFASLMINEFKDLQLECNTVVPSGNGYPSSVGPYQVCTLPGSESGQTSVSGPAYLSTAFQMETYQLWRNFGILIAFWIFFLGATMYAIEATQSVVPPAISFFERENAERKKLNERLQERKEAARRGELDSEIALLKQKRPFTWEALNYSVPVSGGHKQLLKDVYGYVLPGTLTALMGASGAGKTTLLDVLAKRKTIGIVSGDLLVNGRPIGIDFQRGTAYCEQLDVHENTATVREALRFSAYLRQPFDVSQQEKDDYVEQIIELLELQDLADAMIGWVGFGLSVEARKRLTIGVELAAKPQLLLFLDEPTSGLDGQSAFNIVRFLRKLAASGQAILCTIHQPNAMLFEHFDRLLLLQRGGETVYFSEIGKNGKVLTDYLARYGAICPPNANPAEFMLEAIGSGSSKRMGKKDWHQIYIESPEFEETKRKIREINDTALKAPEDENVTQTQEYATPWLYQLKVVTARTMRAFWRQADYGFTRLFSHGVIALIVALTFLNLGDSVQAIQYKIFIMFFATIIPAIIIAQVEPVFIMGRNTFLRESSSKMYTQPIFAIAQLISEMPYSVLCAVVYFVLYYYPTRFNFASDRAGYAFFMILVAEVYSVTLGQAVAALTPSIQVAALINPFLMLVFGLFCGVTITQANMPYFWRSWMYQLDPFTRLISGLIVTEFHDLTIECGDSEFYPFKPPSGQSCATYAGQFINSVGGYLKNPDATDLCEYCTYRVGDQYYKTLNLSFDNRWRDIGIFIAFVGFNIIVTIIASKFLRFSKR